MKTSDEQNEQNEQNERNNELKQKANAMPARIAAKQPQATPAQEFTTRVVPPVKTYTKLQTKRESTGQINKDELRQKANAMQARIAAKQPQATPAQEFTTRVVPPVKTYTKLQTKRESTGQINKDELKQKADAMQARIAARQPKTNSFDRDELRQKANAMQARIAAKQSQATPAQEFTKSTNYAAESNPFAEQEQSTKKKGIIRKTIGKALNTAIGRRKKKDNEGNIKYKDNGNGNGNGNGKARYNKSIASGITTRVGQAAIVAATGGMAVPAFAAYKLKTKIKEGIKKGITKIQEKSPRVNVNVTIKKRGPSNKGS